MYKFSACLLPLAALVGCAGLPTIPAATPISVDQVVDRIRCELADAVEHVSFLKEDAGYTAGVSLDLQVVNDSTLSANLNLGLGLQDGNHGLATPKVTAQYQSSADRKVTLIFKQQTKSPLPIGCDTLGSEVRSPLANGLGLSEWIQTVQATIDRQRNNERQLSYGPKQEFAPDLETEIQFTITPGGTLGADFSLLPIADGTVAAGASLQASRKAVHHLKISMTKNELPKKGAPKVPTPSNLDIERNNQLLFRQENGLSN